MYVYIYMCIQICIYIFKYVCIYIYKYVYIHIFKYEYISIYIYHIYTHMPPLFSLQCQQFTRTSLDVHHQPKGRQGLQPARLTKRSPPTDHGGGGMGDLRGNVGRRPFDQTTLPKMFSNYHATVVFSPVPAVYTNVSRCSPSTQGTARPSASPSHQKVPNLPDVAT